MANIKVFIYELGGNADNISVLKRWQPSEGSHRKIADAVKGAAWVLAVEYRGHAYITLVLNLGNTDKLREKSLNRKANSIMTMENDGKNQTGI